MIADALHIVYAVKQIADHRLLTLIQGQIIYFNQIFCQFVIDIVNRFLIFEYSADICIHVLRNCLERQFEIFCHNLTHMYHFQNRDLKCQRRGLENTLVQMRKLGFPGSFCLWLAVRLLSFLYNQPGKCHQLFRKWEQKNRIREIEKGMEY